MKKILAVILCISILISPFSSSHAASEFSLNRNDLRFLERNSERLVYTFIENGVNYKYVEIFISEDEIVSEKYKLIDGIYHKIDETNFVNKQVNKLDYSKLYTLSLEDSLLMRSSNWIYHGTYTSNTRVGNLTIGAIALILGNKFGGNTGLFIELAGFLFGAMVDTVYHRVYTYRDGPIQNRPRFKDDIYHFTDSNMTIRANPFLTTTIYDSYY